MLFLLESFPSSPFPPANPKAVYQNTFRKLPGLSKRHNAASRSIYLSKTHPMTRHRRTTPPDLRCPHHYSTEREKGKLAQTVGLFHPLKQGNPAFPRRVVCPFVVQDFANLNCDCSRFRNTHTHTQRHRDGGKCSHPRLWCLCIFNFHKNAISLGILKINTGDGRWIQFESCVVCISDGVCTPKFKLFWASKWFTLKLQCFLLRFYLKLIPLENI